MTNKVLAQRSGLTVQRVAYLSLLDQWDDIPVGQMCRFMDACGVLPSNQWKHVQYFKRSVLTSRRPLPRLDRATDYRFRRRLLGLAPAAPKSRSKITPAG